MQEPKRIDDISELCLDMQDKAYKMDLFLKQHNIPMKRFETYRTAERQKWCYDRGTSKIDGTNKIGEHQKRRAFDYVVNIDGNWSWDYEKHKIYWFTYGGYSQQLGLEWGGLWKSFKDYPHSQLKG